ncbi:TldD/PmbA family protein [Pseudomonas sp. CCM 7893]|uniref:TldD/PmbA family protein n=1 Tax=Pseudomonas spelaei TaxID=1055469 RepID=A0A6I3WAW7_9PSED|nr:metallopeptidase TldD-related protein [Pseudomonas spelaei]MUF07840.1 TldD/PmbA family protein [Pseudomonas spelaei]
MSVCLFAREFNALEQWLKRRLGADEHFTLGYEAEDSQFVRFNHGKVRQAYPVLQMELTVRLIRNQRHSSARINLSGAFEHDTVQLGDTLQQLRDLLDVLPADPYLLLNTHNWTSEHQVSGRVPEMQNVIDTICDLSQGLDMVGIYAGGKLYRGFASSWGAHGWHQCANTVFDWSLFDTSGEAVKTTYGSAQWDVVELKELFHNAREQLEHLGKPRVSLKPGQYRAYLAPAALDEVLSMLSYSGFSAKAFATRQSPLQLLQLGKQQLSPLVSIRQQASTGFEPGFGHNGMPSQDVELIGAGKLVGQLINSRSGAEYGLQTNDAGEAEIPHSLVMDPGELATKEVLRELGTGLYISNLWYLNYSDVGAGRLTGMTRFATFWVENGRIVGPIETMRFDDSVYDILGTHLLALTREQALCIDSDTYERRHLGSHMIPGALLEGLTLTL